MVLYITGKKVFQCGCQFVFKRFTIKQYFQMDKAYLRFQEGENAFKVSLRYKNDTIGIDKRLNFARRIDEPCSVFLSRIKCSIEKLLEKKEKKKKKGSEAIDHEITPIFLENDTTFPEEADCRALLTKNIILNVGNLNWSIEVNAPWLETIALPKSIMVGFPVCLSKFDGLFLSKSLSQWTWYKSKSRGGPWTLCSNQMTYIPVAEDIGYFIKVVCLPRGECGRSGPPVEAISPEVVQAGPGTLPFEKRHEFTKSKIKGSGFRIVSYNILADLYVDSEYSRTVLFGYCPAYALELSYRKQLLFKELLGYNGDVICLQEVDSKVFRHDLRPLFESLGLKGEFSQKGETASEGTATFYNENKFQCLKSWRFVLGELLKTEALFADIWSIVSRNDDLATRVTQLATTLQILLLEVQAQPDQLVVLANTHLYFHPDADHIRLLQAVIIIKYLESLLTQVKNENKNHHVSLVLCGDFNSVPECGIFQLVTKGFINEDNIDWRSNEAEAISGISHSHKLRMTSACGTPEYTNYTVAFKACLDYIFYEQDRLTVTQSVPLPSEDELSTYGGIPSVVFPSDHIALVCDLQWK